ncbi:hypothetical protein [Flammeovirga sp. EKP202]|uniref:hypothetical protein n=1 Tax=Flammeovirga sp. EKP202 TaxID=2770592 RepID=UPI00165F47D9|nr:hypothetical protein [Flammeovirga sp. EKP202]MBD0405333.1 hypothetical protein [Flammeovirga sp. EKP202]
MDNELTIIKDKLLDQFISRYSYGDTWWMYIGEYYLEAHTIEFEDIAQIDDWLKNNYKNYEHCIDKEEVPKSTLMSANMRKNIINIELDRLKNLTLYFENGSTMKVLTNTDIVDWQWSISKNCKDPYQEFDIACFWAGKIEIRD